MSVTLSLSSRVTVSDNTLFQDLSGEAVLLELSQGVYFGLDEVGTRIWHLLGEGRTLQETVDAMVGEYDVTFEQGADDLFSLVNELKARRLIEIDG